MVGRLFHNQDVGQAKEDAGHRDVHFFFSSRRRHTRLTCDCSSDVCSSDLWLVTGVVPLTWEGLSPHQHQSASVAASQGSEERRVGKESRSRWSPYHYKKKTLCGHFLQVALTLILVVGYAITAI